MNPINEIPSPISNLGVNHHESDEDQSWSYLIVPAIAALVGIVFYAYLRNCLFNKRPRDIPPILRPIIAVSQPNWVKKLKNKGAQEVCSWVFHSETVTIFLVKDQFSYILTRSFTNKEHPTIWYENSEPLVLNEINDNTLSIHEKISRIQKRLPIFQGGELIKFGIGYMGEEADVKAPTLLSLLTFLLKSSKELSFFKDRKLFLVDGDPIRWVRFYDDRDGVTTILPPHTQYCRLRHGDGRDEGIFDSDLNYAEDYFEFAHDEYYVSVEGWKVLQELLPEMCEFDEYKPEKMAELYNEFNRIKNTFVSFRMAIQQAQSVDDRRRAFESYIPFETRLSWMADFHKGIDLDSFGAVKTTRLIIEKIQIKSQLDRNVVLNRESWAATLVDTGTENSDLSSSNPSRMLRNWAAKLSDPSLTFGHAVLVIEGVRKGCHFMWRTHLRSNGVGPPKEVKISDIPIKGRTRTWQVNRTDSEHRKGVMSVVREILEEKRTGVIKWGYTPGISATHNCSTWAIEKLNEMLWPAERLSGHLSMFATLLDHKATKKHS